MSTHDGSFGRTGNLMAWLRRRSRPIALGLLIALAPMAGGCYGRFPLTKAIYRFNGDVSKNKVIQSVIFWIFIILPVYELARLGDALILNLIEFWSGESLDVSSTTEQDGTTLALTPSENGREAVLRLSRGGELVAEQRFIRQADGSVEVRDARGRLSGRVVPEGDLLRLTDAAGMTIRTIAPAAMAATPGSGS
jgi:hypothetical protein